MVSNFCKKCGSVLIPVGNYSKCPRCGKEDSAKYIKTEEKLPEKEKIGKGVVDDENVFATYEHECSKCGHVGAEVNDLGVQYSDEDNLFLAKCGKCGHSERIGDSS